MRIRLSVFQFRAQFARGFQQPFVTRTRVLRQIRIADQRAERFDQAVQMPFAAPDAMPPDDTC